MKEKDKIKKLIEDTRIGMFTTQDDNQLVSRPIAVSKVEEDHSIWFFTDLNSDKVDEIISNKNVNFSFSNPGENDYVSVSGKALLVKDQAKIDELWSFFLKAYFPEGKDADKLTLVKVTPETAQYWDGSSSKLVELFKMGKAIATGKSYENVGEAKSGFVKY